MLTTSPYVVGHSVMLGAWVKTQLVLCCLPVSMAHMCWCTQQRQQGPVDMTMACQCACTSQVQESHQQVDNAAGLEPGLLGTVQLTSLTGA